MNHITADGRKIPLTEMSDNHLLNTIRFIERRSETGVKIENGGGSCPDDFWYESYVVYGKKALKALNYDEYVTEALRRLII